MSSLFGTDGIRGIAGSPPLDAATVARIAQVAGRVLLEKWLEGRCRVLLVRDTRTSSPTLARQVASGLLSQGIDVYDAGILSTPSVAYLVVAHRFQTGVVISASHNPPSFNGIKFFSEHGFKWPDTWEKEVESRIKEGSHVKPASSKGVLVDGKAFSEDYEEFLISTLGPKPDFSPFRVALDCSNGATYQVAPELLKNLGANLYPMGVRPNGMNINVGCGSQDTRRLRERVLQHQCDIGISFDGDGDRVMFIDEKGSLVDGDHTMALLADYFLKKRLLTNHLVVITVMANIGLKKMLQKRGIKLIETPVGDRHVSEAMRKGGAILGGEQSGHIILGRYLPSGDGLLTALHVLKIMAEEQKPLSRLVGFMKKYPQVLVNVPVREKRPLEELDGISVKIRQVEKRLKNNGRVLIRYSGTEPLLRIMLEGPDKRLLDSYANELVQEVNRSLG